MIRYIWFKIESRVTLRVRPKLKVKSAFILTFPLRNVMSIRRRYQKTIPTTDRFEVILSLKSTMLRYLLYRWLSDIDVISLQDFPTGMGQTTARFCSETSTQGLNTLRTFEKQSVTEPSKKHVLKSQQELDSRTCFCEYQTVFLRA